MFAKKSFGGETARGQTRNTMEALTSILLNSAEAFAKEVIRTRLNCQRGEDLEFLTQLFKINIFSSIPVEIVREVVKRILNN